MPTIQIRSSVSSHTKTLTPREMNISDHQSFCENNKSRCPSQRVPNIRLKNSLQKHRLKFSHRKTTFIFIQSSLIVFTLLSYQQSREKKYEAFCVYKHKLIYKLDTKQGNYIRRSIRLYERRQDRRSFVLRMA